MNRLVRKERRKITLAANHLLNIPQFHFLERKTNLFAEMESVNGIDQMTERMV